MSSAMQELLRILDLERLEHNLYRGASAQVPWQRVFGGQVVGQALVAAQRTVQEGRFVHSLHGYFMLPGDPAVPILYDVDRIRDGASFTTRRVVAIQHGQAIFSLEASFHVDEPGLDHQIDMPANMPPPESLPGRRDLFSNSDIRMPETIRNYWRQDRPIDMKPVDHEHYLSRKKLPPYQTVWVRTTGPVPDDRAVQSAVLAYLSDLTILDTSTFPHGRALFDPSIQAASLDHAIWFHRPHKLDGWLLYSQDSPSASGARGFTRGSLFDASGRLVASVAQEGLIRERSMPRL